MLHFIITYEKWRDCCSWACREQSVLFGCSAREVSDASKNNNPHVDCAGCLVLSMGIGWWQQTIEWWPHYKSDLKPALR
jgi:hypothetical protein